MIFLKFNEKKNAVECKSLCTPSKFIAVAFAITALFNIGTCLLYSLINALRLRNTFKCTSCSVARSKYSALTLAAVPLKPWSGFTVFWLPTDVSVPNIGINQDIFKKLYILYCNKFNYRCLCRSWNRRENINSVCCLCIVLFTAIWTRFAVTALRYFTKRWKETGLFGNWVPFNFIAKWVQF